MVSSKRISVPIFSIHKVVGDLNGFFEKYVKDLNNHVTDMKEHQGIKVKEQ